MMKSDQKRRPLMVGRTTCQTMIFLGVAASNCHSVRKLIRSKLVDSGDDVSITDGHLHSYLHMDNTLINRKYWVDK